LVLGKAIRKHVDKLKAGQFLQKVLEEGMCFYVPHFCALNVLQLFTLHRLQENSRDLLVSLERRAILYLHGTAMPKDSCH